MEQIGYPELRLAALILTIIHREDRLRRRLLTMSLQEFQGMFAGRGEDPPESGA